MPQLHHSYCHSPTVQTCSPSPQVYMYWGWLYHLVMLRYETWNCLSQTMVESSYWYGSVLSEYQCLELSGRCMAFLLLKRGNHVHHCMLKSVSLKKKIDSHTCNMNAVQQVWYTLQEVEISAIDMAGEELECINTNYSNNSSKINKLDIDLCLIQETSGIWANWYLCLLSLSTIHGPYVIILESGNSNLASDLGSRKKGIE